MSNNLVDLPVRPFVIAGLIMLAVAMAGSLLGTRHNDARQQDAAANGRSSNSAHAPPQPPTPPSARNPLNMPNGVGGSSFGSGGKGMSDPRPSEIVTQPSLFSLLLRPLNLFIAACAVLGAAGPAAARALRGRFAARGTK